MNKILVTGGAGFIGSCLVERLIKEKDNFIVVVDNLSTGKIDNLPNKKENWKFIKCNCNDYKDIGPIMIANNFDFIFHYAAVVGVARTLENPISVLIDIDGIKNILYLSKSTGVKRVFYASSSEVYGEPFEHPQSETTTPLNSRLPYAVVKNVGEVLLRSFQREYGLDYTIFRFFNTYGQRQSKDFVIPRFIKAALNNKDIQIYGTGDQTRTFCYQADNVEACVISLMNTSIVNEIINIGNDEEISILELANKIRRITDSKSRIVHLPALKEGDMTRRKPDNEKMKKLLGRELVQLDDGLKITIEGMKLATENLV